MKLESSYWPAVLHRFGLALLAACWALASAYVQAASSSPVVPRTATVDLTRDEWTALATAGEPAAPSTGIEETVELSTFVVSEGEDRGYQAFSTLGVTRLRTDLRDLPASISVVTEDLAADSLDVLASYLIGTEVGGIDGNYSDATGQGGDYINFDNTQRALAPNIGIGGLAAATRTRDYLIPAHAQPDGSIDAYRIGADMTWSLSNSLEF